tara:strand:+ start:153 stop:290 length:138 start_codon:yes stop_codon:yes gene_type:complete
VKNKEIKAKEELKKIVEDKAVNIIHVLTLSLIAAHVIVIVAYLLG